MKEVPLLGRVDRAYDLGHRVEGSGVRCEGKGLRVEG